MNVCELLQFGNMFENKTVNMNEFQIIDLIFNTERLVHRVSLSVKKAFIEERLRLRHE